MSRLRKLLLLVPLILCAALIGVLICNKKQADNSLVENNTSQTEVIEHFAFQKAEDVKTTEVEGIEVLKADQVLTEETGVSLEIPALNIVAPVLEGVDDETIAVSAGHFPETAQIGEGNYCVIGHSSDIYNCVFNNLKNVQRGMQILVKTQGIEYSYFVTDTFVVEPTEVWVLDEFGDNRITIITCTDSGLRRQVVVGLLMLPEEYNTYIANLEGSKRSVLDSLVNDLGTIQISKFFDNFGRVNTATENVDTETDTNTEVLQ